MFTGLIECQGIVTRAERVAGGMRLEIYAPEFGRDMSIGDSVAVDGACLTIIKFVRGAFLVDVSDETVRKTTIGTLRQGSKVNLERALRMSDRMGGHIVSGHVDAVGSIAMRQQAGNSTIYRFRGPSTVMRYLVPKGSIAVDGISLTVSDITHDGFAAAVIPHTEVSTTLKDKPIGAPVNLEVDMLAKYVKRFVELYSGVEAEDNPASQGRRGLGDLLRDMGGEGR